MSIPSEILKKVKLLEISTRKLVNNMFTGEYHSAFKGQGMTFSEFREYIPGDDVRTISWPVTARTGKPFIKKFDEEREMTVLLAVDVSGSSHFGSQEFFKGEVFNHLAALLSFTANKNNDPVGLLLFSDQIEHFVPPKKGHGHIHRILRDLFYIKPKSQKTNLNCVVDHILAVMKKKAHVFVFSDFFTEDYEKSLKLLGQKHDTVAVVIHDPAELEVPQMGLVDLYDPETGEIATVDTSSNTFQRQYKEQMHKIMQQRDETLKRSRVDRVDIVVGGDYTLPLVKFFKQRNLK